MLRFKYTCVDSWPANAWIARLRSAAPEVEVWCGRHVERRPHWFCEAVWNGEFEAGAFDRTDIVAGSGARARPDGVVFVSSNSTVDRLQHMVADGDCWVSNSLVCLLARCDATPDPAYPHYISDFNSIVAGIDRYVPRIATDRGDARLVYFRNLHWNGTRLEVRDRPRSSRNLATFESYVGFLTDSLSAIVANMANSARALRYRPLGTLSTGYDSTAVTALTRPLGVEQVICFERDNRRDVGSELAPGLGVEPIRVPLDAWRALEQPEIPFLAANAHGEEVHFAALADSLDARVLFTGYHGDKVWDRDTTYLTPDIRRGDVSGLSLTEFRLWAGFIHCPVPFFAVQQIEAINRISRSSEMARWDVGGDYTRPICRRIVESAGVPRAAFGVTKSHASRWFVNEQQNITARSRADHLAFIERHRAHFWRRLRVPPSLWERHDDAVMRALYRLSGRVASFPGLYRSGLHRWPLVRNLVALRLPNPPHAQLFIGLRAYYFGWAMERAKARYRSLAR